MTKTATPKLLIEKKTRQSGVPRVDWETGIIHDVKFLGNDSDNDRRYGYECRRKALPLYEGAIVNQNHPKDRKNLERPVQDWVGVLRNVRAEADGSYGDIHMRTKHADYEVLMEAAQKFWENFGLSHVAFGEGKRVNGVEVVHTIEEVRSVDIVLDPATCANLFESRRSSPRPVLTEGRSIAAMRARIAELEQQQADEERDRADFEAYFQERAARARARLAARRR